MTLVALTSLGPGSQGIVGQRISPSTKMTIDPLQGLVKIAVRHGPLWSARLGTSFGTYPSGNRMWDRSVACSDLAMTTNEHTAGISVSPVEDVPSCGTALVLERAAGSDRHCNHGRGGRPKVVRVFLVDAIAKRVDGMKHSNERQMGDNNSSKPLESQNPL